MYSLAESRRVDSNEYQQQMFSRRNNKKKKTLILLLSGAIVSSYKQVKMPKTAKLEIFVTVLKPQEGLWVFGLARRGSTIGFRLL